VNIVDIAIRFLLMVLILLNFSALASSRMKAVIRLTAIQGAVLGLLLFAVHRQFGITIILMCLLTITIKSIIIPHLLDRAMREVNIRREVEPILGFVPSLVLGGLGTAFAFYFANALPLADPHPSSLIPPSSLSTIFVGFLFLTTRTKAISQVLGYLILENGIFVFGLLLVGKIPFMVEIGVLLDLFVAVFVMGIILNNIQRTFSSIDMDILSELKE